MLQRAKVIETRGKWAVVDVYRSSACGENCGGSCDVCKTAHAVRAEAENTIGARAGDIVELESESGKVLGLAFVLYILPLIIAVAAYCGAVFLGASDDGGALAALGGLLVGFVPALVQNRRAKRGDLVHLRVTRIL